MEFKKDIEKSIKKIKITTLLETEKNKKSINGFDTWLKILEEEEKHVNLAKENY